MRAQLERRFFLVLLITVTFGFGLVLEPFWGAIFWAAALAVIFYPLQSFLLYKLGNKPNRVAALTLLICVVMVVLPLLAIGASFVQEGISFYQRIEKGELNPEATLDKIKMAFPLVTNTLQEFGVDTDNIKQRLSEAAVAGSRLLAEKTFAVGQNAASLFLNIGLMLYLAFFLLRDGAKLVELFIVALPLGDERERMLFAKFAEVTRATVKGNLVVAVVQGVLGGIILWILDVPAPILWGVVMTFLSLLPAIGAALVWFPVALYLYSTGQWWQATVLIAYGALVIGLADNILRPLLVGRDTKLPDYIVLFSTLGGITLLGINGFVLGPLIAALFLAFWQIFITEFNQAGFSTASSSEDVAEQRMNSKTIE
ncbi:AI-2E family transporter [Rheinheimera riviphila]|uniref:AI-2E family transporter n=1 Tax=Rheinheimera riviphila TaxID=1834037 RepID=A0A437R1Q9_9GAMM|nr:AI-2E family transporter [Rheinheimera riviphila]RVU40739.1 AI-2E family transporter [Rheinheimera riviphila]